jgi:predicted small integral membrane protein
VIRITKIAAAVFIGLIGLLVFLGNLVNLESAFGFVSFVIAGSEQPYYKIIGPVITAGWLTWIALFVIMALELAIGILGLSGAFQMIQKRGGTSDEFNDSKAHAVLAGIAGMLLWYGFFIVIGEGYFQMWQTDLGLGSVAGAFRYGTVCAVLMFFISSRND